MYRGCAIAMTNNLSQRFMPEKRCSFPKAGIMTCFL